VIYIYYFNSVCAITAKAHNVHFVKLSQTKCEAVYNAVCINCCVSHSVHYELTVS